MQGARSRLGSGSSGDALLNSTREEQWWQGSAQADDTARAKEAVEMGRKQTAQPPVPRRVQAT
jgi:hypothetical protein